MRFNKILSGVALLVGISTLSGCSNEPYEITREEQYARDFINTFGLIAPGHDWTAAQHSDVTVNTASPTTVKIYADFNGETYLFGKYDVEAGSTPLKFDIPKGATNYRLKANGRKLAFTPGQTVDLTASNLSRAALGGIKDNGLGESGTYDGVKITIEKNTHRALTLLPDVATEVLSVLPENNTSFWNDRSWGDTPVGKNLVTDNFVTYAKEFYLFPEYWDTGSAYNNIIGIYWIEDEPIPGVTEEVVVTDKADNKGSNTGETIATYNVVRVPFFKYPMNFYTPYKAVLAETYTDFTDIPDWKEAGGMWEQLTKKFPDKYSYADGKYYRLYSNGVTREIGSTAEENDINHECAKDIFAINNLYIYTHDGSFGLNDLSQKTICDFLPGETGGASSKGKEADFYESYGVHVKLSDYKNFGFYLENGTRNYTNEDGTPVSKPCVMYSQTFLNSLTSDGNEYKQPSYIATFLQGTDTEGNPKRHLCFEDWYADNFDMNDMVFRVYGFDRLDNPSPDIPIETGKVYDIYHPDEGGNEDPITPPTPPTTDPDEGDGDDDNTTDKAFQWVVACEDLGGTDDYDFNDVVFGVEHVSGEREVKITALAAGGTLETKLFYNEHEITGGPKKDTAIESTEFYQYTEGSDDTFTEWHQWFGNYLHTSMINTSSFSGIGATVVLVLTESEGKSFTMTNSAHSTENFGGFSVQVINTEGIKEISAPVVDETGAISEASFPQMFVTTNNYKWPTERTPIYESHMGDTNQEAKTTVTFGGKEYKVYPNSFHDWVQNNSEGFHAQAPTGNVITWRKAD